MLNKEFTMAALLSLVTMFFYAGACAEDIIIGIGNGSGAAGSHNNSISLYMDNATDIVKGLKVNICDEGNYLTIRDCVTTGRASNLSCVSNECRPNASIPECRPYPGCANIVLYAIGDVIKEGTGPIASIKYDVSEDAPTGCINLIPKAAAAKTVGTPGPGKVNELSVMAEHGQFCIRDNSGDDTTSTPATDADDSSSPDSADNNAPGGSVQPNANDSPRSSFDESRGKTSGALSSPEMSPQQQVGGTEAPASRSSEKRSTRNTTSIPAAGSSPPRLVISPAASVIHSRGVLALGAQTIAGGREIPARYQWEITPPSTIGSSLDADGIFTAGENTSSSPVEETIRVTDTTNRNISATATITIEGLQEPPEGCELSLSPSSAEIASGSVITFTPRKLGSTCDEGSYQWKVNSTIGSTITAEGVYTAGVNPHPTPAIDIVMIQEGSLTADALLTVQPNEGTNPASSSPHDTPPSKSGSLHPGVLIAMAVLLGTPGILLLRKKFKR